MKVKLVAAALASVIEEDLKAEDLDLVHIHHILQILVRKCSDLLEHTKNGVCEIGTKIPY